MVRKSAFQRKEIDVSRPFQDLPTVNVDLHLVTGKMERWVIN